MRIKGHNRIDPGFSLSSMTDLVFLLLVFFVIVSTMVSPFALPVDLPKSSNARKSDAPQLVLRMEADGACTINGSPVGLAGLETALQKELTTKGDASAIVFRPSTDLTTGLMVTVLDMAKRNRWKIVLASTATPPAQAAIGTADATVAASTTTP